MVVASPFPLRIVPERLGAAAKSGTAVGACCPSASWRDFHSSNESSRSSSTGSSGVSGRRQHIGSSGGFLAWIAISLNGSLGVEGAANATRGQASRSARKVRGRWCTVYMSSAATQYSLRSRERVFSVVDAADAACDLVVVQDKGTACLIPTPPGSPTRHVCYSRRNNSRNLEWHRVPRPVSESTQVVSN